MHAKTLFAVAAVAASLLATAAYAQQTSPPHVDMPLDAQKSTVQSTEFPAGTIVVAPVPVAEDAAANIARAQAAGIPVRVELVTNGPVPDTPATRSQYPPLSNAGKRTAPAGN